MSGLQDFVVEKTSSATLKRQILKGVWQAAVFCLLAASFAIAVNQLRPEGIALIADWSPEARLKAATGGSMVIPLSEAVRFYDSREAVFVDARPAYQFAEGHIPGALLVPWQERENYLSAFLEKVDDKNSIIICYCDGESCSLSEDLAMMLQQMGYLNVKVLVNGWTVWTGAGYPAEKGTYHES